MFLVGNSRSRLPRTKAEAIALHRSEPSLMRYLDPSNDVVFKLLFGAEENEPLLRAMITAVLEPPSPIASATVLNPELPSDLADAKSIVLDLRVRCDDGTQLDIEMETEPREVFRPRLVFYWARLHASQLSRGEPYSSLSRTIAIAWLGGSLLAGDSFHSTFRILEERTHAPLSDELEIHVLELPKRHGGGTINAALRRWADFLASPTEDTLRRIADEDSTMKDAVKALERVSESPENQSLAEERKLARWNAALEEQFAARKHAQELERALDAGRREGLDAGRREGLDAGRREGGDAARFEIARRLVDTGLPNESIAAATGLGVEVVEALRKSNA